MDYQQFYFIADKMSKQAGRNDPCPCGSGKKYKSCCWGKNIPQSDLSRKPLFARAVTANTSSKRTFAAKLIQGKTKDMLEDVFAKEITAASQQEAPPAPPTLEVPPQHFPADYKEWKKES